MARSVAAHLVLAAVFAVAATSAAPTITTDVTALSSHAQSVTVTVSGVTDPSDADAVGFLVPYSADRSVTAPQKFQWCLKGSSGAGYLDTGITSLTFTVIARQAFTFLLVRNPSTSNRTVEGNSFDWTNYTQLAQTRPIPLTPTARLEPTQIHLLATNDPTQVKVQWTTAVFYPASAVPTVYYGPQGSALTMTAVATPDTYTPADLYGPIANSTGYIFPGYFWTATMTDLAPGTMYDYQVGAPSTGRRRQLLSADAKPKPHPKPHAKPHPKPHAKPHPKPHPKPHAKPHPKPHAKPHPKPHAKPHPAPTAPRMTAPTAPAADRLPSLSAVRSFKSAPAEDATVKILIYADLGYAETDGSLEWDNDYPNPITYTPPDQLTTDPGVVTVQFDNVLFANWVTYSGGHNTTQAMIADNAINGPYSLAIHNGDISYAQGFTYGWDQFWLNQEPHLSLIPWATTPGNHERNWPGLSDRASVNKSSDSGGEGGVIYDKRMGLGMPIVLQRDYYSFDHGPIHFVQFSTEVNFEAGSDQHAFVIADLAAVDRSKTPWVVAGFHRPYITPTGQSNDTKSLQGAFDDVFMQYQVDFTTYGHIHTYARTCPVYGRICQPNAADGSTTGVTHLLLGQAGASFSFELALNPPAPYYEVIALAHGYSRIRASKTFFEVEVVDSITGNYVDQFTYTKPYGWQPNMARQLATIASYAVNGSGYVPVPYETSGTPYDYTIVDAVEPYLFAKPGSLAQFITNGLIQNPETPDYMGDMNPFWQTLDSVFGALFNATTPESSSAYTSYFHPLFQTFAANPNGVFLGPFVGKTVPALPVGTLPPAPVYPIPTNLRK